MADLQTLIREADALPREELQKLYAHIKETLEETEGQQVPETPKPRILGLHSHLGKAWMSDDFMDELPDSFWLGEE